jgi:hypothetical protein
MIVGYFPPPLLGKLFEAFLGLFDDGRLSYRADVQDGLITALPARILERIT